ncbi:acyl-CoA thioesterase [Pseudonocardia humida]|uniref:Acyl-CoA thioesterase n=1 Tax=Pseudonocardia humida TaxID=2800819 RepID=A0ABT1A039_9PSEU|nr:acyl-CoA thioesterase [Pseudonocardia humida]MCO1656351.1 acyl-CoA thioesterase [Pseudonocardia humida]
MTPDPQSRSDPAADPTVPPAPEARGAALAEAVDEEWAFRVVVAVRSDDLDPNGHVRGSAYLAYGDHARWAALDAAGVEPADLRARRIGPVNLETTLRYHRELRPHDAVEVVTAFEWGTGRTSRVRQQLRRGDGVLAAEVSSVGGLLDLDTRRLLPDPGRYWLAIAARPELLGLG